MVSRQRLTCLVALLLVLTLLLVACERPIPGGDDTSGETTTETGGEVDTGESVDEGETTEAEAGEPTDSEEPAEASEEAEEAEDTPRVGESEEAESGEAEEEKPPEKEEVPGEATEAPEEEVGEVEEEVVEEEAVEDVEEAVEEAETAEEESVEEAAAEETETEEEAAETGIVTTHTVSPGENLYRIGLRYNVSWVTLAEFNGLANANDIKVGQVLNIPTETPAIQPEPTPSPLTETTYTVQVGDNLFTIGLLYGITWVQIAEANGLVNPGQIYVGQVLKIPVDAPGPTPQFTHRVKPGETLFLIALQYGVPWPAIAEANNIGSPFVIYSGQTLAIPGGQ